MEVCSEVSHRITVSTLNHCILKTLFNCGVEVLRNYATNNGNCECKTFVFAGGELNPNVTKLTGTTVLLLVLTFNVNSLCNLFSIRNCGDFISDIYTKAVLEVSRKNVEVHITHTVNKLLSCFSVIFVLDCLIFFTHTSDSLRNLAFVLCCERIHSSAVVRCGIFNSLICNVAGCAECIVCICRNKLGNHTDIATCELVNFNLLVTLHNVNVSELFVLTANCVLKNGILLEHATHNLEEGHLTYERVSNCLEYEDGSVACEVDVSIRAVSVLFCLLCCMSGERACNGVHHSDNAPKSCSRATVYGSNCTVNNTLVESFNGFFLCKFFAAEELFHHFIRCTCESFLQNFAILFNFCFESGSHICGESLTAIVVNVSLHVEKVNHCDVLTVLTYGDKYGTEGLTELFTELCKCTTEVSIVVVTLIDKECLRNACLFSLIPSKLCTNFHTCLTVYADNYGVSNTSALSYFTLKVKVAGSIYNINFYVFPKYVRNGRREREFSCLFFCIVVTNCVTVRNVTESVGTATYVKHSFCKRCLTTSAVTCKRNVSDLFCVVLGHCFVP